MARVEPDPLRPGHSYAVMRDYLPFDAPVPFRDGAGYREAALRAVGDPRLVGRTLQGRSVREISEADFAAIIPAGLASTLDPGAAVRLGLAPDQLDPGTAALLTTAPAERRIEQVLLNRKVRDAAFRRAVLAAYEDTCAVA